MKNYSILIKNIVCTFRIEHKENFDNFLNIFKNAYKPKKFHGIVIKNNMYSVTYMIFRSGAVIATGIKNEMIYNKIGTILVDDFKNHGINLSIISNPKITNIVATTSIHTNINLNTIKVNFNDVCYEPEISPSAIFKITSELDNKATIFLTKSGHIYCSGSKNFHELLNSINSFIKQLSENGIINEEFFSISIEKTTDYR